MWGGVKYEHKTIYKKKIIIDRRSADLLKCHVIVGNPYIPRTYDALKNINSDNFCSVLLGALALGAFSLLMLLLLLLLLLVLLLRSSFIFGMSIL